VTSVARPLPALPSDALVFLETLETVAGVPQVDEDERRRLDGQAPIRDRTWHWTPHLVTGPSGPLAYLGLRLPPDGTAPLGTWARLDLALDRRVPSGRRSLAAALRTLTDALPAVPPAAPQPVPGADAPFVQAWIRGASDDDLAALAEVGFGLLRRLHVLSVRTDALREHPAPLPDGVSVRRFRPDVDDAAVAALLAAVYPANGGAWDVEAIAVRRGAAWFHAEDLLVAEDAAAPGRLVGLHWTKRRSSTVGEVHNLAVHPEAQGGGLGPALLDAGLAHLTAVGCAEVILWVDSRNERAHDLYRSRGFLPRWDDVALRG